MTTPQRGNRVLQIRRYNAGPAKWIGRTVKNVLYIPQDSVLRIEGKAACNTTGRVQNSFEAPMTISRESIIILYGPAVVQARDYKEIDMGRSSTWGEEVGYHPKLAKLVVTATGLRQERLMRQVDDKRDGIPDQSSTGRIQDLTWTG